MFNSQNNRRRRIDAAASRVRHPRSRRLALESMENRLLLSGNQATGDLDYSIWNLDSLQTNYAIISQGDSLPSPSTSTSSAAGPSGADLDVSWIAVPDMRLSAGDAQKLAYQQYRAAMSQGVINFEQSSALYRQWQAGFSSDAGSTLTTVYTIGIRSHTVTPEIGGLTDLFSDHDSFTDTAPVTSDFTIGNTPSLVTSLTSAGSSFGVYTTPIQYNSAASGLDDDVRSSGDFNRDGLVNAADYQVWRDVLGPTDVLAYNNWRTNFGQSVAVLLNSSELGSGLALDHGGVLDSQQSITIDVAHTPEIPTSFGPRTAGFDVKLVSQDDTFAGDTPRTINLNPSESFDDAFPTINETTADQGLMVNVGPITITTAKVANIATSGPTLVINIDGGSSQLVVSPVPKIETPSARQSQDKAELDQAIDELLADDTIIVSQSGEKSGQMIAEAKPATDNPADSTAKTDVAAAEVSSENSTAGQSLVDGSAQEATEFQLAEGGMISLDEIVDAATSHAATAPSTAQIAAEGEATELVGELSRVAVMELIEGEAELDAPQGFDYSALVAASGATESSQAVQIVTEQAGLAITLISPVNPAYLASFASAASHAFAAVVNSELSAQLSDAARNEAFSEWGDADAEQLDSDQTAPTADHESNGWLDMAPLVVALACERTLAAKKKRRQREPDRKPVKAKQQRAIAY